MVQRIAQLEEKKAITLIFHTIAVDKHSISTNSVTNHTNLTILTPIYDSTFNNNMADPVKYLHTH